MTQFADSQAHRQSIDFNTLHEEDLLGFALESLLMGHVFSCETESIQSGGLDDQPFCHTHQAFPEWSNPVYRSRAWTAERLIWLSIHQETALVEFLNACESSIGLAPQSKPHLIKRLHHENPIRLKLCGHEVRPRDVGLVFTASMKLGYRLSWESKPDYWSRWHYEDNRFWQEHGLNTNAEKPAVTSKNNEAATIDYFASHYDVIDGTISTLRRHGLPDLWFALTHLGFRTIREFAAQQTAKKTL